jgi:hypothetical protein
VSKIDQAKLLMRARKLQKELQKEIITVETGEGAVKEAINKSQKLAAEKMQPMMGALSNLGL